MSAIESKANVTFELYKGISKAGNEYVMLRANLGYTKKAISFKAQEIAEYMGMSVTELYETLISEMETNEAIEVVFK